LSNTSTKASAKDRRPALDCLFTDARRRRLDVLVCWRLDRLGRNLKHLVTLLEELQSVGVAFVSLGEGIDCGDTVAAVGRLENCWRATAVVGGSLRLLEQIQAPE